MATYTLTSANIAPGAVGKVVVAGAAIAAGQWVYLDAGDSNKAKLADNTTEAKATVYGMAIDSAVAAGQPLHVMTSGAITVGAATFSKTGQLLVISPTAGKMMDVDDLPGGGEFPTVVGWSTSATAMMIAIQETDTAFAAV